jgi:ATP-binding protein involved in chromosome partitioning
MWQNLVSRISGQFTRVSTAEKSSSAPDTAVIRKILEELGPHPEVPSWSPGSSIDGLSVSDGKLILALTATPEQAPKLEPARKSIEDSLSQLPGIEHVQVILTAKAVAGSASSPTAPPQKKFGQHATGAVIELPRVENIIAIGSGKGGVGKSTTTANLAMALAKDGLKVGILDADVYGPSIPMLLGCQDERPAGNAEGKIIPIERFGLKLMSIGFMVDQSAAMIWRGPMASGAIEQLFRDVEWGELDVLLVDLPPGTGDIQITMVQKAPLTGAVIVSTPQDLALLDARRALTMFQKVNVPVHGFIENMSYYQCPNCGHKEHIFNHGGAETAAEECGVDFLGAIPLTMAIRQAADGGEPITSSHPNSPQAKAYTNIATKLTQLACLTE